MRADVVAPEWGLLTGATARVYGVLIAHVNARSRAWILRVKQIAEMAGTTTRTVYRAFNALERLGYLERETRYREDGSQQANRYRLTAPYSLRGYDGADQANQGPGDSDVRGGVTSASPLNRKRSTEPNYHPPTPRQRGDAPERESKEPGKAPAPQAPQAPQAPRDYDAELLELTTLVRARLAELAATRGEHVYRQAAAGYPPVLKLLSKAARARGLSGRLRTVRGIARQLEADQADDTGAPAPAATPDDAIARWEALSDDERFDVTRRMEARGYMDTASLEHYATPQGWMLYKRRLAEALASEPVSR